MSSIASIERVAIIDDYDRGAEIMSEIAGDAGYTPTILPANGEAADVFAATVQSQADAALCDHRLQHSALYGFDGAQLVAELTKIHVPAILITQFPMDADVSIRKWRDLIPVLLKRDDADPDRIKTGLEYCVEELRGYPSSDRRAHRCLVRVIDLSNETGDDVIDAIILSWNANQAVRFPKSLLGSLQGHAAPGARFFAEVNTGTERSEDLFLRAFELAPEVVLEDGLA